MAAATPLLSRLETLPREIEPMVFACLATRDLCALSTACKDLHQSILRVQAREPAYVQRVLTAYQSPAHPLGSASQRPDLDSLDEKIRRFEIRLGQIREAQRAAPDEDSDHSEEIAFERKLNTLRASRLPPRRIIDLVLEYYHPLSNVIDTKQWNVLIGQVPNKPLLLGTEDLLRQPCSIFHGKTKGETHVCVDIPPTVDGQPLTLNRILHFVEHNRGNLLSLTIHLGEIIVVLGDTPIPAGQCLLLKTCLPGTKNKTYQDQLEVLRGHPEYMVATLPQVLVASLMEYIRSGGAKTRLFDEEYARTSATIGRSRGRSRLSFGGSSFEWPCVSYGDDDDAINTDGLAVVLRPGGSSPVLGP